MADLRNRANVLTGGPDVQVSGGIQVGNPVTKKEEIPTDAKAELAQSLAAEAGGFVSQDGITKTVDRSTEKIKDWNGDTIIVLTDEHTVTLKLTFMEAANGAVLKNVYGEKNVIVGEDGAIKLVDNSEDLPHFSVDFAIKSTGGRKIRVFAPDVQVTNVGDVNFVRSDLIKYEVELECFTDVESNKLYSFIEPLAGDTPSEPEEPAA